MSFTADKVFNLQIDASRHFVVITANVEAGFEFVQFYVAGSLLGFARAVDGLVTFSDGALGPIDPVFPLAVDAEDVETNFWDDAFPEAATSGNRIKVQLTTTAEMLLGDKWRVSIDGAIVHEADIYPTSDGAGGWGVEWGTAWGVGPFGGGWGSSWGSNWGLGGGIVLEFVSGVLFNGTYSVATQIIDAAGNVSTADTDSVTIATYPRPATDLVVVEYVKATDTLSLAWGESEDI